MPELAPACTSSPATGHLLLPVGSGHTGDMRVLGLPSGREITHIPCFVPDALVGWGITNESKAVMGTKPDSSLKIHGGRYPPHPASYKDGNYDGRYAWINDKINSRLARIRLDYFICDKIAELPNVQGFHGISRTSATRSIQRSTTPRACSAAPSSHPLPNTGSEITASTARCSPAWTPRPWKCAGKC